MDADYNPPRTNRENLLEIIPNITADGWTPLAEVLYEAATYFRGEDSPFHNNTRYTSPILATCQTNHIILISDGMSRHDRHSVLASAIGDQDGDGHEPGEDSHKDYGSDRDTERLGSDYLDDVAKYLYDNDHASNLAGQQNVLTYTVGFGEVGADAGAVKLLNETIANGTGGAINNAYLATDMPALREILKSILAEIRKVNTSFAAPIIPASPQNRYASGERVYFGLFKPTGDGRWLGNLKKYGLDAEGQLLGSDGQVAVDEDGRILDTAISYWSTAADGREVSAGGAGEVLLGSGGRRIYSNIVTNTDLTYADNAFALGNSSLTAAMLNAVDSTERDRLINFVRGIDVYDDDGDGDTTDRRSWILGDILHPSPVTVHYDDYAFTSAGEADITINKSLIFAASNDGQLHAFRDADGEELWSFIPDILLSDLEALRDGEHTYLVDMAPEVFIFDPGQDGPSDPGDQVILLFGLRRGAGKDLLLTDQVRGAYYALDVTTPDSPQLLWKLSADVVSGFDELGEAWSPPTLARMKVKEDGTLKDMLVAVFGAGYDNNEDLRYGNTQGFPKSGDTTDTTDTTLTTDDAGNVTSSGKGAQHNPRGRGLFAVKVGEFGTSPGFTPAKSVKKVWGYSFADNAAMHFGIPAETAALDLNHDGYVDRFYVGDTGGQLWRLDAASGDTNSWQVNLIFQANGGTGTEKGRKFFYRPSVTVERNGQPMIFIGSGDRVHPLNEAVVDRLYAVRDPAIDNWDKTPLNEDDLTDVTENTLQGDDEDAVSTKLVELRSSDGWFIRIDQTPGEKVLASPLVFNGVTYFTSFTPTEPEGDDPCKSGNLGTARIYAVDYRNGEAVFNYDLLNDSEKDNVTNNRAKTRDNKVLRRSDRERTIGSGIPSEVKVVITEQGEAKIMSATDAGMQTEDALPGSGVRPLYWLQR